MVSSDALHAFQSTSGLSPEAIRNVVKACIILFALLVFGACDVGYVLRRDDFVLSEIIFLVCRHVFLLGAIVACFAL